MEGERKGGGKWAKGRSEKWDILLFLGTLGLCLGYKKTRKSRSGLVSGIVESQLGENIMRGTIIRESGRRIVQDRYSFYA